MVLRSRRSHLFQTYGTKANTARKKIHSKYDEIFVLRQIKAEADSRLNVTDTTCVSHVEYQYFRMKCSFFFQPMLSVLFEFSRPQEIAYWYPVHLVLDRVKVVFRIGFYCPIHINTN